MGVMSVIRSNLHNRWQNSMLHQRQELPICLPNAIHICGCGILHQQQSAINIHPCCLTNVWLQGIICFLESTQQGCCMCRPSSMDCCASRFVLLLQGRLESGRFPATHTHHM